MMNLILILLTIRTVKQKEQRARPIVDEPDFDPSHIQDGIIEKPHPIVAHTSDNPFVVLADPDESTHNNDDPDDSAHNSPSSSSKDDQDGNISRSPKASIKSPKKRLQNTGIMKLFR
jgi:hypothetical protein